MTLLLADETGLQCDSAVEPGVPTALARVQGADTPRRACEH